MKYALLRNLVLAAAVCVGAASAKNTGPVTDNTIAQKAVHEVRMYPHYSIYDNINVRVENGNVELMGQVSQPYKKSDLQNIMKRIPGVTGVTNDLTVLPLSPFDDRLRAQVARAIYRDPVLSRYGMGALPSIHIIVDNGRVTLEGVVNNDSDRNIAGIRASSSLSFGAVVNHLQVENPARKS